MSRYASIKLFLRELIDGSENYTHYKDVGFFRDLYKSLKFGLYVSVAVLFFCSPLSLTAEDLTPATEKFQQSLTAEERQWIKNHPVVITGGERDWAPFDFVNGKGEYVGIVNEYLQEISLLTGLHFKIELDSWGNLQKRAKAGKLDLLPILSYSEERARFLSYTDAYYTTDSYVFSKEKAEISSINDLEGKNLSGN